MVSQINFYMKTHHAIGSSNTQVNNYIVNTGIQTMVLTLTLANITNNSISANVFHNDGNNNTAIVSLAPVPIGGSLVINKINLQNGHSVYVCSNTANSIDCSMSIVEMQ